MNVALAALGLAAALPCGYSSGRLMIPFDLERLSRGATHIVVTTTEGVVLESWRGDLKPGDRVGIGPAGLPPSMLLALEYTRLRPEHPLGGRYRPGFGVQQITDETKAGQTLLGYTAQEGRRRLVLFLRRTEGAYGGFLFLSPAASSPQYHYHWSNGFSDPNGDAFERTALDLASSTVWVEDGVVFGLPRFPGLRCCFSLDDSPPLTMLWRSFSEFRRMFLRSIPNNEFPLEDLCDESDFRERVQKLILRDPSSWQYDPAVIQAGPPPIHLMQFGCFAGCY